MKKENLLPIFNNREYLGHARSIKHATSIIRQAISIHSQFKLKVWERPAHIAEILGLPIGYVYAVSMGY